MATIQYKHSTGYSMIEVLLAVAIFSLLSIGLFSLINQKLDDMKDSATAIHHSQYIQAGTTYLRANYTSLLASATSTTPAIVTTAMLKGSNALATSIGDNNPYNQTSCLLVLQPTPNMLEALIVTEGGVGIPEGRIAMIAANSGRGGGFIPRDAPTIAQGAYGYWSVPNANYISRNCSGTASTVGHLASAIHYDKNAVGSDFLYRFAIPGRPELNRMATAIDMNTNNINNVNNLNSQNINNAATVTTTDLNSDTVNATTVNTTNTITTNTNTLNMKVDNISDLSGGGIQVNGNIRVRDIFIRSRNAWLSQLLPLYSSRGAYVVNNGTVVAKPSDCGTGGTPKVIVSPATVAMQVLVPPGYIGDYASFLFNATDLGGSWRVNITSKGAGVPASDGVGIAHVYCEMP